MSYADDAKNLIDHGRRALTTIKAEYAACLHEKAVKPALLIAIKNFMENLRSALDYTAHRLFDKYGTKSGKSPQIYFPYARAGQTLADFRQTKRIETCIPGITTARPDVVTKLETMQHWTAGFQWLPKFMDLNNENKHQQLTPQTRTTSKELRVSSGGAGMSLREGASISIGHGASMQIGGLVISGEQHVSTERPPVTAGEGTVEMITWVSFNFSSNGEPVLPFLEEALRGCEKIVQEFSSV